MPKVRVWDPDRREWIDDDTYKYRKAVKPDIEKLKADIEELKRAVQEIKKLLETITGKSAGNP